MAPVWVDPSKVREFADANSFYVWLGRHWDKENELWIKIHKLKSGRASITPGEAIDIVLCWGWIDGIRKGFDAASFLQRYTPRGKNSIWSQINIANAKRLVKTRKMRAPGLAQMEAARADGRWAKAYRMTNAEPPPDLLRAITREPKALAMWQALSSRNRFAFIFRTMSMKTEAGRKKKIAGFVAMLKKGATPYPNGPVRRPAATRATARSSGAVQKSSS